MGTTYHLFNAQRVPVGRMAVLISQYIRGKNKPTYVANQYQDGDKCVVVNMSDPLFTGRKRQQKIYRHHTGYPGGLKEYNFKTILEKNPERILHDAVMGMLPKNTLRKDIIKKNLIMFRGPYHTMQDVGLPQFTDAIPENININLGLNLNKEDNYIEFKTARDGSVPEEFKDFEQNIDETMGEPLIYQKKTHTEDRANFKLGIALKKSYKNLKRYKTHK